MTQRTLFGSTALAASLAFAPGAWAEITASDVWTAWQTQAGYYGQMTLSGTESRDGTVLTLTDVTYSGSVEEGGDFSVTIPSITLTENGDGTVNITLPEEYPLAITVNDPSVGEPIAMTMTLRQPGFAMVASGTPEELSQTYVAPELVATLTDFPAPEGEDVDVEMTVSLTGMTGGSTTTAGDTPVITTDLAAETMAMQMNVVEPSTNSNLAFNLDMADLNSSGGGTMALIGSAPMLPDMLKAGMRSEGTASYGATTFDFNFREGTETAQGSGSLSGGDFSVSMSADGLEYTTSTNDLAVEVMGTEIPFPLNLSMARNAFNMKMPVTAAGSTQEFALGLTLGDFTMSDMIWSMFDPGGILPRDPATIQLDLTGTAKLLVDIFNPEAMATASTAMPGEVNSLSLNTLLVEGAGTKVAGDGAFTFDNSDLATFDGFPRPAGQITLSIEGANGLIDKLIQMGFVAEEDAMGARMMLGMFATPVGEDQLSSTIVINEQGHVIANGQRLR